jgi:ribosomal protein S18 acetylase RimI-like enzyme
MEGNEVEVRQVHPGEWETLRDVRLAALADAPGAFSSTLGREAGGTETEWRSRINARPWFLAWRGGQPAGLVGMFPEQGGAGHPDWHLVSMWVRPDARGAGIAERLVSAVIEHAAAAGAPRVTLWVAVGNDRARSFYLRMGFTPTGTRRMFPRDGAADLDEEELARALGGRG